MRCQATHKDTCGSCAGSKKPSVILREGEQDRETEGHRILPADVAWGPLMAAAIGWLCIAPAGPVSWADGRPPSRG